MRLGQIIKTSSGIFKVTAVNIVAGIREGAAQYFVTVDLQLLGTHTYQYTFRRIRDVRVPYVTVEEKEAFASFVDKLLEVTPPSSSDSTPEQTHS